MNQNYNCGESKMPWRTEPAEIPNNSNNNGSKPNDNGSIPKPNNNKAISKPNDNGSIPKPNNKGINVDKLICK
jgi:hypothetical protein